MTVLPPTWAGRSTVERTTGIGAITLGPARRDRSSRTVRAPDRRMPKQLAERASGLPPRAPGTSLAVLALTRSAPLVASHAIRTDRP